MRCRLFPLFVCQDHTSKCLSLSEPRRAWLKATFLQTESRSSSLSCPFQQYNCHDFQDPKLGTKTGSSDSPLFRWAQPVDQGGWNSLNNLTSKSKISTLNHIRLIKKCALQLGLLWLFFEVHPVSKACLVLIFSNWISCLNFSFQKIGIYQVIECE